MTTLDWIIVAAFLLSTSIAGWRTRKLIKNYDSYLLAGRKVRFFLGMATLGATELGLVTMMYLAQQGYKSGFSTFILGLMALAGLIVIGKTGFIITGLRRLRCRTVSEYYGKRYGRGVQILGAIVLLLAGLINMGTFLIAGATFIVHLIGLNPNFLPFVMTGLLVFVLFYTVLGGMVSVLITDYLQFAILMIGVVVTSVLCVQAVGYTHLIEVLEHEKVSALLIQSRIRILGGIS